MGLRRDCRGGSREFFFIVLIWTSLQTRLQIRRSRKIKFYECPNDLSFRSNGGTLDHHFAYRITPNKNLHDRIQQFKERRDQIHFPIMHRSSKNIYSIDNPHSCVLTMLLHLTSPEKMSWSHPTSYLTKLEKTPHPVLIIFHTSTSKGPSTSLEHQAPLKLSYSVSTTNLDKASIYVVYHPIILS